MVESIRKPVFLAVSLCTISLCMWISVIGSKAPPFDRRISTVALSNSGRWLAAGTIDGRITVWDQTRSDATKQIMFPRGVTRQFDGLNDLQFSPDEQGLAIASEDLGLYAPAESAAPRVLRSDHANYGSTRFSRDSQNLLVITGSGVIETVDVHTGALRLKVCCSSVYGAADFTPDGRAIVNAGHWPSLWDAGSGQLMGQLTANREFETFGPIAFDVDRDEIFMGSQDGRVYAWDLKTRRRTGVSPSQSSYVKSLAISTSGWVIFAGFGDGVQLWNPQTGLHRSLPMARPTSNLVIGHNGTSIIFGTAEGAIETWDVTAEQRLRSIRIPGA